MTTGRPGGRGGGVGPGGVGPGGVGPGGLHGAPRALRSVRRPSRPATDPARPVESPDAVPPDAVPTLAVAPDPAPDPLPAPGGPDADESEGLVTEDELVARLRARSAARGVVPVGPATAAALTFLAAATRARSAVEIGTGLGVGTVSLLRGMPADGLLTSIDVDEEHQRTARDACVEAGFGAGRVRMITGRALQVLPRLSDAGYDLVVVDAVATEYPLYLAGAVRLLRPGGVVVLDGVGGAGRVADPVRREAVANALRETVRAVRDDERWAPLLLPLPGGLLCAALR